MSCTGLEQRNTFVNVGTNMLPQLLKTMSQNVFALQHLFTRHTRHCQGPAPCTTGWLAPAAHCGSTAYPALAVPLCHVHLNLMRC